MRTPDPRVAEQLEEISGWLKEPVLIDPDWLTRMLAANSASKREVEGFFFLFDEKQPLSYTMRDGVAVLPISGPIAKKSAYRVTYDEISGQVEKAVNDRKVRSILLNIDSPGGVVAGMYETAGAIKAAAGVKPIYAIANDYMTSAAYGLASGASKVYSTRYGTTGSIGVVLMHVDYSKQNERIGVKPTFIFGGRKKTWGNPEEPLGEEARAELQKLVDHHYADFTQMVAAHRNLQLSQVLRQEAGTYLPEDAQREGLVDGVRSFDECANALAAEGRSASMSTTNHVDPAEPKADVVNIDDIREKAKAEAKKEAAERTKKIRTLCGLAGKPELAGEMIDSDRTPDQVAEALIELRAKEDEKHRTLGAHGTGLDSQKPTRSMAEAVVATLKARGIEPRKDTLNPL